MIDGQASPFAGGCAVPEITKFCRDDAGNAGRLSRDDQPVAGVRQTHFGGRKRSSGAADISCARGAVSLGLGASGVAMDGDSHGAAHNGYTIAGQRRVAGRPVGLGPHPYPGLALTRKTLREARLLADVVWWTSWLATGSYVVYLALVLKFG